jgi:hypothetical protein
MWRSKKPRAPKQLDAKGLFFLCNRFHNSNFFCIVEIAALVQASQVSEQGNVDYRFVLLSSFFI